MARVVTKNPGDRRKIKSQESLMSALNDLFVKHSWQDITISLICKQAKVSRSTFYEHYNSKEALLEALFTNAELAASQYTVPGRGLDINRRFNCIIPFLDDMKARRRVVTRQQNDMRSFRLAQRYIVMLRNAMNLEVQGSGQIQSLKGKDLTPIAAAIAAHIKVWVDSGCATPQADLLKTIDALTQDNLFG